MFANRYQAGQVLADHLIKMSLENPVVFAIPRGGIIVAAPIAKALHTVITVLVTRKLGHPQNPELAIGSLMPDGTAIIDPDVQKAWGITDRQFAAIIRSEKTELIKRQTNYHSPTHPDVRDQTIIIVDDGIATGYTIKAALRWLHTFQPRRTVLAVPVAPADIIMDLIPFVDELICPLQPSPFAAVGYHYQDFSQTIDQEIQQILCIYGTPSYIKKD